MTTDEIIQAFQKVKTEDPKTYYNAMGAGDDGINIMHPFIGDAYALGLVAGAKYALEHFTKYPPHRQVDLLCAGLGALSKRVKDRIKNNDKYPDRPNSAKHKAHNEARLLEIEALPSNHQNHQQMKPILDACCGGRMFYFDKEDPRVLYQDIRDEEIELTKGGLFKVHPDVVADFRNMPYPDNTFRMVVFDPPHMVYYSRDENASHERRGDLYAKYGELRKDWRDYIKRGFAECFRVLQPGGFLIFKWSDTDIKVKSILSLTPERPVFGHKSGKSANTHWICFMKEGRLPSLNQKELKLVVTYKWYDMIEAGEKPEEYRDLTEFYRSRLEGRDYDLVTFYRGYAKDRKTMSFKYGGYRVGTGQEKWGAVPGKQYYIIKLGERL